MGDELNDQKEDLIRQSEEWIGLLKDRKEVLSNLHVVYDDTKSWAANLESKRSTEGSQLTLESKEMGSLETKLEEMITVIKELPVPVSKQFACGEKISQYEELLKDKAAEMEKLCEEKQEQTRNHAEEKQELRQKSDLFCIHISV